MSKQDLIRSVDLKFARAQFQANAVAEEISAWTTENPVSTRSELLEDRLGFRLIFEGFAKFPPLEHWGLLVGECVHNLRSSIDNLAYALARLKRDPPDKPERVRFPICEKRSKFRDSRGSLDQMPEAAAKRIEDLQPFQRNKVGAEGTPESDPLVLLQRLNNDDKHRLSAVVIPVPTEMMHLCSVEFYSEEDAKADGPPRIAPSFDALQPGTVFLEQRTNRPIAKVRGNFQGKVVVALQVIDKRPPVVQALNQLGHCTAQVVNQFRGFFE